MSANLRTRVLRPVRNGLLGAFRFTLKLLPLKGLSLIVEAAAQALHARGDHWVTLHRRPKTAAGTYYLRSAPVVADERPRTAIVLQGPIVDADDFTAESVAYYRNKSPEAVVIVSTWDDTPTEHSAKCEAAGALIVTSPKPVMAGAVNVNFQTTSSAAGLRKAQELGCEYALKVRADLRIYAPEAVAFLGDLLRLFPVRNTPQQRARLISSTFITSKYAPFFLSDHLMFGQIDDMLRYWAPPLNRYSGPKPEFSGRIHDVDPEQIPEIYLCRTFCAAVDRDTSMTVRAWWNALADQFIVVDRESLDIYWPKYGPHIEHLTINLESHPVWAPLYFRDWLRLYLDLQPDSAIPEDVLNLPALAPAADSRAPQAATIGKSVIEP